MAQIPPKAWFDTQLRAARAAVAAGDLAAARAVLAGLAVPDGGALGPLTAAGVPRRLHALNGLVARAAGRMAEKVGWQATQGPPVDTLTAPTRLHAAEAALARRMAQEPVPRVLHQIWIGPAPVPVNIDHWQAYAAQTGYAHRLWREADLAALGVKHDASFCAMMAAGDYPGAVDVARYAVLYAVGGLYLDADWFPARGRIDDYVPPVGLIALPERIPRVTGAGAVMLGNNLIGAPAGHPAFAVLARAIPQAIRLIPKAPAWWVTGPVIFTRVARQCPLALPSEGLSAPDLSDDADLAQARATAQATDAAMFTWKSWRSPAPS